MNSSSTHPRIRAGVDWGSSSFRAYHFDDGGSVIDSIQSGDGIKTVVDGQFESTLFNHIESWLETGDSVLLSGMITSRSGWQETPYLSCPVRPASDPTKLVRLVKRGINLLFMPGLCQRNSGADVMRGEELQLLGASQQATASDTAAVIILPGTHSKWALTDGSSILAFKTIATGELFDCLVNHSLVGDFAEPGHWDDVAFLRGVNEGYRTATIVSQLFTARAGVLLGELAQHEVYAYLSGLLIGNEIKEGEAFSAATMTAGRFGRRVTLVGSELLCGHYQRALEHCGFTLSATHTDAAAEGFSSIVKGFTAHD